MAEDKKTVESEDEKKQYNQHTTTNWSVGDGIQSRHVARKLLPETDEVYLQERVTSQIDWHSKKSKINQVKYKKLKRTEFILAASIPVFVGFSSLDIIKGTTAEEWKLDTVIQIIAAIAGVMLVIINKLYELEEYHKLWKDYRVIAEQLEQEKWLYLTHTEPYDEEDAYHILVETVEDILNKNIQKWKQIPKRQEKNNEQKEQVNEKEKEDKNETASSTQTEAPTKS